MSMTTTTNPRPGVALPAGATAAVSAREVGDQRVTRTFAGTERGNAVYVGITGQQDYSGDVLHRGILVDVNNRHGMVELDVAVPGDRRRSSRGDRGAELPAAARQIATDLIAAADELDELDN